MALAALTVAAFFVTQHLKVSTPLLDGTPCAASGVDQPRRRADLPGARATASMRISFYLLNRSDDVDVDIVDPRGAVVASIASGVHMQGGRHPVRRGFHVERPHVERPRGPRRDLLHPGRR